MELIHLHFLYLLLLLLGCIFPGIPCQNLTDIQKQQLLRVEAYKLDFHIVLDVKNRNFYYTARTELHFDVDADVDELLFDCRVAVHYVEVLLDDKAKIEGMLVAQDWQYFRIKLSDDRIWKKAHYALIAYVGRNIFENPMDGIYYTLHYDRLTKER